jgi:eukaryotic-like serine/threonine-protein kinase
MIHENDRADAGSAQRDAAHESDGSPGTIGGELPQQPAAPFQSTERDGSQPRLPDEFAATTLGDGTLHYGPGAPRHRAWRNPESQAREGPLPGVPGYEVLGELGRGGMGVVYRARQVLLDRPCALKMILTERSHDPNAVTRLLHEAQAVARLQHRNIVEIYSIGDFGGRPYLELEYVEGGSLALKLQKTPQPVAYAAEMVETFARAIEVAHRAEIVHRDLKPSNILLTKDGTPKISDFGLAKDVSTNSEMTETYSIMGSPHYMAPEQAGGRSRQVGPFTDVYSLGVILYEMLTGRPPFQAESLEETLDLVRTADPVPPSRLRPRLPADLETICLTCLRKEPSDRYPSAAALANDLERFRSGRAILARRAGLIERGLHWSRRNRPEARLVGVLVVVVVTAMVGLSTLWARAERHRVLADQRRREAEIHLAEANRQRVEAVRNLLKARAAVDEYLARIGGSAALRSPALRPLRRELLHAALTFHRQFLSEQKDDPTLRAEMAAAHLQLARVNEELLDKPAAEAAYRAALADHEALACERPEDDLVQEGLAQGLFGLACCRLDSPEALEPLSRVIAIREKLASRLSSSPVPRLRLAETYQAVAARHRDVREHDEALRTLLKAREITQGLARDFPTDPRSRYSLGVTLHELAALHHKLDRPRDALELGQQALPLLRVAFLDTQLNPWYGAQLARACDNLGAIQLHLGQGDEALRSYAEASRVRRRVAQSNPAVAAAHSDLIASERELSRLYGTMGRVNDQAAALRRAHDVIEGLPKDDPGELYVVACVHALNSARANDLDDRRQEADQAVAALRRAIAAGWRDRDQLREDPDLASLRDRDDFRALMGGTLGHGPATATPAEQWLTGQLALAVCERRSREHPDDPARQADLAAARRSIGLVQIRLGQIEPGLESLRDSIAIRERLVQEGSSGQQARVQLALDLATLVEELWRAHRWRDSRVTAERSLRVWETILRERPDDPYYRAEAAVVRACFARSVFQTGELNETRHLFEQARASFEDAAGADHLVIFGKARVLALASKWQPGLGDRDREDLADAAIQAVQDALAAGYRDDAVLADLPDFEPLHQRPEFDDILVGWTTQGVAAERPPGRTDRIITESVELLAVQEPLVRERTGDPQYRRALASTYATLGDARRLAGERAAAVESHRLALRHREALAAERPDDAGLQADLASSLIALALDHAEVGLWEEAAGWLEKSLAIRIPEQPEIWNYAILLRTLSGNEAGARDLCERGVARFESSEHPLVATILARASALSPALVGPADRLERLGRAAIETYPNEPWVRFVAGMSLYRIGQSERAQSELRRCLNIEPLWPAIAVDWCVLAMTAQRLGREAEARSWLEKAEDWWSGSLREMPRRRELRLPVPWWDFAELEILLREARSVVAGAEPAEQADRFSLRARAHAEVADPAAAAADLRHACELRSDDAFLRINLGRSLIAAGRDDLADAEFRRAVGLRPRDAELRIYCGRAWADSGRRERGAAYFDEAVALEPDDPIARIARGRFLKECGESERADADFAQAAVTAQDDPNAFLGGWWIAGPYPDASEPDTTRGPAHALIAADSEGTREVPWRFLADTDMEPAGFVEDFRRTRNASAYAMIFLFSTRERDVTLLVTCDPSARLWLNGRLIREPGAAVDRFAPHHRVPVSLRAGRNVLLARVANGLGEPRLSCRADGVPTPLTTRSRLQ